ncbi:MAG: hypothetical protein K2Q01_12375 [Rickettsiales bacterium]|nr:hypothetical protein [Rickettsiales bacterium]
MVISTVSGLIGAQAQSQVANADNKLRTAIANIARGKRESDVATVAIASQLQSVTAELRQASGNLALGSSLSQVADGGVEQISNALNQLRSIAQQASSPVLNDENRAQLNEQFQQTLKTIDDLARNTSFNGKSLLDGSLTGGGALSLDSLLGSTESGLGNLSIGNLNSQTLLGGAGANVLSADSAGQALSAIAGALNQVTATRTGIGAFQQSVNFAAANVDSAIFNQEAAQAVLSDTDLATESTVSSLAEVQRNAAIALAAQGNRLAPQLLQLVG